MILGIAALIFGLASIIPWFGVATFVFGSIGLILGIVSRKKAPSQMATAGIIMSAIGLGLAVLFFVSCMMCLGVGTF